jgi:hypothetical protein
VVILRTILHRWERLPEEINVIISSVLCSITPVALLPCHEHDAKDGDWAKCEILADNPDSHDDFQAVLRATMTSASSSPFT